MGESSGSVWSVHRQLRLLPDSVASLLASQSVFKDFRMLEDILYSFFFKPVGGISFLFAHGDCYDH